MAVSVPFNFQSAQLQALKRRRRRRRFLLLLLFSACLILTTLIRPCGAFLQIFPSRYNNKGSTSGTTCTTTFDRSSFQVSKDVEDSKRITTSASASTMTSLSMVASEKSEEEDLTLWQGGRGSEGRKYNISLLIIDHYDSFTYNLYDYFAQIVHDPPTVITKDAYDHFDVNDWKHIDGIILSPGPGCPEDQPSLSHEAISKNPNLPIFGVCLGHQLLALQYNATVAKAPTPIHGQDHWITTTTTKTKTTTTTLAGEDKSQESITSKTSLLFQDLPSSFRVVRYHSLAAYNLPSCLTVTARSHGDEVIQAMEHNTSPHYGVQFHPESIGTQHGMTMIENFCKIVEQEKYRSTVADKDTDVVAAHVKDEDNENEKENDDALLDPSSAVTTSIHSAKSTLMPTQEEITTEEPLLKNQSRFRVVVHPVSDTTVGPEEVFHELYRDEPYAMWLDSSSALTNRGTIDIMAVPTSKEDLLEYHNQPFNEEGGLIDADILTQIEHALLVGSSKDSTGKARKEYTFTKEVAIVNSLNEQDTETKFFEFQEDSALNSPLPFQYRGGYLGYLGYEVRYDTERHLHQMRDGRLPYTNSNRSKMDVNKRSKTPTAAFFLARNSLVFYHPEQKWYLVSLIDEDQNSNDVLHWMRKTKDQLQIMSNSMIPCFEPPKIKSQVLTQTHRSNIQFQPNRSKETYVADIDKCHDLIKEGETYELCLTNQLVAELSRPRLPWDLYRILRRQNPAPYSAFFHWKDKRHKNDLAICCSSPERFMSVQRIQTHPEAPSILQAEAKPIKGTEARVLPRDGIKRTEAEEREDKRRARTLELSQKNRAENLMIVDLLRNDMSRVCQIGSVHVAKLMAIESFATVHQMVSTIRGTLATDVYGGAEAFASKNSATSLRPSNYIDLLRASFPGGSMTGAPKIRTMELLHELEDGVERGPYAGSLGYLSVNGCMDMNIIIRSAVVQTDTPKDDQGVTPSESASESTSTSQPESTYPPQRITIGAGGAITALSEREDEYKEMMLKAQAIVQAVYTWAGEDDSRIDSIDDDNVDDLKRRKGGEKVEKVTPSLGR